MNELQLARAGACRRALCEPRHAELLRDAARSLGRARLSKNAPTSPVWGPVQRPGSSITSLSARTQPGTQINMGVHLFGRGDTKVQFHRPAPRTMVEVTPVTINSETSQSDMIFACLLDISELT